MSLPSFATRYPVTVSMAILAVALLGALSFDRLGTDLLPDLRTPVITVELLAPGKAPREIEERYTRRLERDISTVAGVRRVYSVTRSGQAVAVAEFAWGTDMDFALIDVQKRMGAYAGDEAVTSVDVVQEDPRALPVMRLAVSAPDGEPDALLGTVETVIKPRLEALAGVAEAGIEGGAEKEARVTLDPYLLEAFGQSAAQVGQAIAQANEDVSGGVLRDINQAYQVKGLGRLRTLADIEAVIVGTRQGEGNQTAPSLPVRVGEVARVALEYKDRQTIARLDGEECVGLAVYKEADANSVQVARAVLEGLSGLEGDLPGLRFVVVENQARFIEEAVGEVKEAAIYGSLLAVAVLFAFLRRWAVTLVVGLAIPVSVLATFSLMYFEGLGLNIMTLGGLALGAGMLVDNAIVVIENIYRHLERGVESRLAAARGASEVGVAILASTLTTVSVFLPIVYLQGLTSKLFEEQAWTVVFSLVSSLAVAMTAVPMLSARLLRPAATPRPPRRERFVAFLEGALGRKWAIFLVAGLALAGALHLGRSIEVEFIPREDQGLFHIELALPEATRLEATDRIVRRASEIVHAVGGDAVEGTYARVGADPSRRVGLGEATGPNRAVLSVPLGQGPRVPLPALVAAIDAELRPIPNLQIEYRLHESALEGVIGGTAAPIQVDISGDDLEVLRRLATQVRDRLDALPTIYNVGTSFQGGQPELDLDLHEEVLAATGFTAASLAAQLERRLSGEIVGELGKDQRSRDIRVGFERVDLKRLREIRLEAPGGAVMLLGDLAAPRLVEGPREILREAQRRVGRVSAYLEDGTALGAAVRQVEATLDSVALPPGYKVRLGGSERERRDSFGSLEFALALSVILVYMVMAALFESLLHPFTVMFSVPLAGVGVVAAFWLTGEPLSVMAFIGIIMLGGIAVNDAIVLVNRINQLLPTTGSVRQAVVQGAGERLRPILMTSATTVLALLPMALGLGEGARLRAPMAIAVIGGLCTSTLMTLLVIPAVFESIERLRPGRQRRLP